MATKRQRGNVWTYCVKRKGLLPKPVYLTFDTEADGDAYCARLEQLLDHGVVPEEFKDTEPATITVGDVVRLYLQAVAISDSDDKLLNVLLTRVGSTRLVQINYDWTESWVKTMKRVDRLSPTTIKHYVGALARCFDWAVRKSNPALPVNPLRLLPKGYATYSRDDGPTIIEVERDRRLEPGEENRIRAIMAGEPAEGKTRPMKLNHPDALVCVFTLALETAMRLREIYTLTPDQIDLNVSTVFLDKTKNGDKRQVPLSTVAITALTDYAHHDNRLVFPWWSGDLSKDALKKVTSRLSKQYARIFEAAQCEGLNFHDLRHEATSRFFELTELSDLEIMKITGHSSTRMLRRYANLRGSTLAAKLW